MSPATRDPDRPGLGELKALLVRLAAAIPVASLVTDLQRLGEIVDRGRRPGGIEISTWVDMKFRAKDVQESVRRLYLDVRLACMALDIEPEPLPEFVGWAKRQLDALDLPGRD